MISNCNVPFESRSSASPRASARTTVSTPPTLGAKKWLYRSNATGVVLNSGRPEPSFFKRLSGLAICNTVDAVHEPYLRRQYMGSGMEHSMLTLRRQRDVLQFFAPMEKSISSERVRCVAVLGRQDEPTDAVEQYCQYLSGALVAEGISLELMRVRWVEIGWRRALRELRESTLEKRNAAWFLMQYTALAWSRRGFSMRALRVIRALKSSGARCAVVFHDTEAYSGSRYVDRMRRAVQIHTMRQALYLADLAVLTIPAEIIPWVPPSAQNIVFIPVGANLPSPETVWKRTTDHRTDSPAVAVFSLSGDGARAEEVRLIAEAVSHAAERIGKLQVMVLGRNSDIGGKELKGKLTESPVKVTVHGLLTAEQVVSVVGSCDVMLFARGPLSTRRGSAVAGISCGLPVVAQEGWETVAPITEAGVVLVSRETKEGFGPALLRVLSDESYRAFLAERSRQAQQRYFSWSAIAAQYAGTMRKK